MYGVIVQVEESLVYQLLNDTSIDKACSRGYNIEPHRGFPLDAKIMGIVVPKENKQAVK
jgi:hypothetical protein